MDRLQPCVLPANGVLRQSLLELLARSERFALTLLLAPAGSGKSTLLQHWRGRCAAAVVHYPLQARDNDPLCFFRRLADSRLRYNLPVYRPHHAVTDALACAELLQAQLAHRFNKETPVSQLWC